MGVGLHTGQVVVGNIGSPERMKYGVVGSHVNLTSRIQSYTIGGQILISETTRQEVGPHPQARQADGGEGQGRRASHEDVGAFGIGGRHKLLLTEAAEPLVALGRRGIPLHYEVLDASYSGGQSAKGGLTKVSRKGAEVRLRRRCQI